ncbi:hypothetical protein Tco_1416090 [Tanacetum coccineum]
MPNLPSTREVPDSSVTDTEMKDAYDPNDSEKGVMHDENLDGASVDAKMGNTPVATHELRPLLRMLAGSSASGETTKNVLITSTYIHLKLNEFVKYATDLPTLCPGILLSGPAGSEIYQETLTKALAKHFGARLLVVESLLLPSVSLLFLPNCSQFFADNN